MRAWIATVVLAAFLAGCGRAERAAAPRPAAGTKTAGTPHNVILVVVDTLRADRLGLHGYARPTSPGLERLAAESVVFDRAGAQAPCTFPSVNSILTSRYTRVFLGQGEGRIGIPEGVPTVGEVLRERGFATAAVSASSVVRKSPSRRNPGGGYDRGFDVFDERCENRGAACVQNRAREILAGLREPYFLYLHYMEPHAPYNPPRQGRQFATQPVGAPFVRRGDPRPVEKMLYAAGPKVPVDDAAIRYFGDLYDDEILSWDREFATFVDELRAAGTLDRTVVAVAADHGEELFDHGHFGHCRTLWGTTTWTPLLLRVPGIEGGRRIGEVVQNLDLVPTLLDLVGVAPPKPMEGRSLRSMLEAGAAADPAAPSGRRYAFAAIASLRSVDDGRFRLLVDLRDGTASLYDHRTDPGEQVDLAAAQPAEVERLRRVLDAWLARVESDREASLRDGDESIRQLRALGYIQ